MVKPINIGKLDTLSKPIKSFKEDATSMIDPRELAKSRQIQTVKRQFYDIEK